MSDDADAIRAAVAPVWKELQAARAALGDAKAEAAQLREQRDVLIRDAATGFRAALGEGLLLSQCEAEVVAAKAEAERLHGYVEDCMKANATLVAEAVEIRNNGANWYAGQLMDAWAARDAAVAEAAALRDLLRELYDGDACDCNAGPGGTHEAECFQTRVEAVL